MEFPSHSRSGKGKKQKHGNKFIESSISTTNKKHGINATKAKQELNQIDDENAMGDLSQNTNHNNTHQYQKLAINYIKTNMNNSESYDSYTENNGNYTNIKITESQPLPKIFSIEEEYFYESNENHYEHHRNSIDDFNIFVPCYKNSESCLKSQDVNHSNSPFTHKEQSFYNEKQTISSASSSCNEDKLSQSFSIDSQGKIDSSLSSLVHFNKNEEDKALSSRVQIPQIGYYKLERAESFNSHCIHSQNSSKEESKRKNPISKSKSVSRFTNQLEIDHTPKNSNISQKEINNNDDQTDHNLNKKADRYGWFITESEVMTPQKIKILQTEDVIELKREQKWIKMIRNWDYFMKNKLYKIKSRIKKGIPDCLRSKVWQLLLDPEACTAKQNKRQSIQSYILIGRSKCCKTIEADLHRTLPHVKMFCDESAINSLREILHAYSNKDPEIGYYQGMAFLAAILLVYLDEVQAFWCFVNLMNGPQLQFRRLFIHKFSGLNELNLLWEKLLALKFPKVAHNLNEENIDPILYTPAWFLCSYISLPFEPTLKLRIFDRTLMFGARALLSFGLAIIAFNKKLLETEKATKILLYLQHPDEHEAFKDWRNVISKFDELWLSQSDYDKLFKITNIPKFF